MHLMMFLHQWPRKFVDAPHNAPASCYLFLMVLLLHNLTLLLMQVHFGPWMWFWLSIEANCGYFLESLKKNTMVGQASTPFTTYKI